MSMNDVARKNLKKFRILKGYTQQKLAELANFEPATIGHYETGRNPIPIERLEMFAHLLQVSFMDFFKEQPIIYGGKEMRKSLFGMDAFFNYNFVGYTNGEQSIGGWECPFFTKEVADKMVELYYSEIKESDSEENKEYEAWYDAEKDTYCFQNEFSKGENLELYDGIEVEIDGKPTKLYPIGAHAWVWCEVEEEMEYEHRIG